MLEEFLIRYRLVLEIQGQGYQPMVQNPDFSRLEGRRHYHPLIWYQHPPQTPQFSKKEDPTPYISIHRNLENPDFLKKRGNRDPAPPPPQLTDNQCKCDNFVCLEYSK